MFVTFLFTIFNFVALTIFILFIHLFFYIHFSVSAGIVFLRLNILQYIYYIFLGDSLSLALCFRTSTYHPRHTQTYRIILNVSGIRTQKQDAKALIKKKKKFVKRIESR